MDGHKRLDRVWAKINKIPEVDIQQDAIRQWTTLVGRLSRWDGALDELENDIDEHMALQEPDNAYRAEYDRIKASTFRPEVPAS